MKWKLKGDKLRITKAMERYFRCHGNYGGLDYAQLKPVYEKKTKNQV